MGGVRYCCGERSEYDSNSVSQKMERRDVGCLLERCLAAVGTRWHGFCGLQMEIRAVSTRWCDCELLVDVC